MILVRDHLGIAQILDQFQAVAQRQDLGTFDVLDIVGELALVAAEIEGVAEGVFRGVLGQHDGGAQFLQALVDLRLALD
ncbi:MAG: hypothetical protein J0626_11770, partial [Rhodospirillaceae bacterium]|nr:hypothetical protein [Rhodospirillaceae bacterium]